MVKRLGILVTLAVLEGCAATRPRPWPSTHAVQMGTASFYAGRFHGRRTANGERYDQSGLTAAHRTLAFGTRVRVTNLRNDRSVIVRINDRGPHIKNRIIDVSRRAARELEMLRRGTANVQLEILEEP